MLVDQEFYYLVEAERKPGGALDGSGGGDRCDGKGEGSQEGGGGGGEGGEPRVHCACDAVCRGARTPKMSCAGQSVTCQAKK